MKSRIISLRRYERLPGGGEKSSGRFECSDWRDAFALLLTRFGVPVSGDEREHFTSLPGSWCIESRPIEHVEVTDDGAHRGVFVVEVECIYRQYLMPRGAQL